MTKFNRWTEQEIGLVKKHYQDGMQILKKKLPNRTNSAITNKLNELQLRTTVVNNPLVVERLYRVY